VICMLEYCEQSVCLSQMLCLILFYIATQFQFHNKLIDRMNYNLNQIPERTTKPRQKGLTMVMDKGLSLRQVEDF